MSCDDVDVSLFTDGLANVSIFTFVPVHVHEDISMGEHLELTPHALAQRVCAIE